MRNHTWSNTATAHGGMLLWAIVVGLSFPAVGLLTQGLPPLLLTAGRFAIAALVLTPLLWRAPDRWPGMCAGFLYILMGLCLAGFFSTMFWAAHRTTALSMATLFVSIPLLTYLLGRAGGVEQRALSLAAILVVGAVGAFALAWAEADGNLAALQFGIGEFGFFAGCVGSALYPVLTKWGLQRNLLSPNAGVRTFWSLVAGGVLIGLLGLLFESPQALTAATLTDISVVVYLGIFSTGLTFWLMQRATAVLTPAAVMAYSYVTPFVSMLLLFMAAPQTLGVQWLPGSILVVAAIILLLRRDSRIRRPTKATRHTKSPAIGKSTL